MSFTSAQSDDSANEDHDSNDVELPPAVTFQSGAELLMQLGIVEKITHQGIRHIAENHDGWPFGEGRKHPYWPIANATVMATKPFLKFFREHPSAGRKRNPRSAGDTR